MLYLECDDPLDAGQAALSAFVSSSPIRRGIRSKKCTTNSQRMCTKSCGYVLAVFLYPIMWILCITQVSGLAR